MSTKGVWYPDRSKASDRDPPLYLHLSASSRDMLQHAIDKINELASMDLGPLVEDKKDRLRDKVDQDVRLRCLRDSFSSSGNGLKKNSRWAWRRSETSMFAPRLSDHRYSYPVPADPRTKHAVGCLCEVHSTRDGDARSNQGYWLRVCGARNWEGVGGTNAHTHHVCFSIRSCRLTNPLIIRQRARRGPSGSCQSSD